MFYFVIPLRSKYSSNNWKGVVKSFNSTIKSIYNQSSANFKILVACHDNPELLMSTDDRLKIFKMDTPVPEGFDQQMMDKFYKKRFLMSEIRKMNEEGFVMFTDADDYVNHRLVSFTEKNNDKYGYFFYWGYEYDIQKNKLKLAPKFYNLCGTSYIIKFSMSEIPNKFEFEGMNFNYDTRPNKYFFDYSHITWIQKRKNIGKTLKCLPFPGSIYTLYTGDNFSLISGKHGLNRRIVRMLTPSFKPTKKIKNRFCLEN